MSKVSESLRRGLLDALEHAKGDSSKAALHPVKPINIKAIREKLGMSQSDFSATCDVSVSTVRRWERGEIMPSGPARALLTLADKEPQAVLRALSDEPA